MQILKLQDIYKRRQLETVKNIDAEIAHHVAEPHAKELTENLLKHWEQECKSPEARAKDEFEKKVQWFKENYMVEIANPKPQNLSHKYEIKDKKSLERTTIKKTK